MGFFDFLRKKKKDEAAPEKETDGLTSLDDVDLSGIEPPETRYTQEYRDFLAEQEAKAREAAAAGEREMPFEAAAPAPEYETPSEAEDAAQEYGPSCGAEDADGADE